MSVMLLAYYTTTHISKKEPPNRLVFEAEAIISVEFSKSSLRHQHFEEEANTAIREAKLNLIKEEREFARISCKDKDCSEMQQKCKSKEFLGKRSSIVKD